ncbi:MAG: glycosyltransferase [Chitinivibrionales bacterium]|nr:glycosyltransferase [Chitinivibrionales bacterium]
MPSGSSSRPEYDICILHLSDARFYPFFQRQAFALRDAGYRVALVSWERHKGEGDPHWEGVDVYPIAIDVDSFRGKWFFIRYVAALSAKLVGIRAKLYQAVDPVTLPSARLAAMRHNTRYCYFSLEFFQGADQLVGRPLTRYLWRVAEKFGIENAEATAVVCRSAGGQLSDLFRIATPHVVRNVPPAAEYAGESSTGLREQLGLGPDARLVLYKGDIAPGRGLVPCLRAMSGVENVHLALVGDGRHGRDLANLAGELGLQDRVHFQGRVESREFPPLLRQADMGHVMHENIGANMPYTLPSKLFDYLHAGLPVLCGNQGEMASIVRRGNLGWVVDPGHQPSVADALTALTQCSPSELRAYRRRARVAAQEYCWELERVAYLEYIRDALAGSR